MNKLNNYSDHQLYEATKKLLIKESLGYSISENYLKQLHMVIMQREPEIFDDAVEDACLSISKIEETKIQSNINKIDRAKYASKEEMSGFFQNWQIRHSDSLFSNLNIKKENLIICEVEGDSMIMAGIEDKDTLIAESAELANHGDIIIAQAYKKNFVKRYEVRDNNRYLISENDNYPNKLISDDMDFKLIGIVKHIIKSVK